jgi:sugar phosphate isomerase/epimerase
MDGIMGKIEIGLSMLFCLGEPFSSLMKELRKVPLRQVELVDEGLHTFNASRVKALKQAAESLDLELTVHAPFVDNNIASPNPIFRRMFLKRLEKSILYASQLDCRLWVFHPGLKTGISYFYPGLDWQLNLDSVHELQEIAGRYGVKIAIENVPEPYLFLLKNVQDFERFYSDFGEDLPLVLDVGHANLIHQTQDFITQFSEKLVHVHASDNDGTGDLHLSIGHGNIDWRKVTAALKESGFNGVVMIESVKNIETSIKTLKTFFA